MDASTVNQLIGRRLRQVRKIHGKSQEQAAEECGLSRQRLQRYETGVTRISAASLVKLAKQYDVDVSFLIQDIHSPSQSIQPTLSASAGLPGFTLGPNITKK
ncbi:MAG: helix-turn-helix transcriptional regulator [Pseudomonadota bacterium]